MQRILLILSGIVFAPVSFAGPGEDAAFAYSEPRISVEAQPRIADRISDMLLYAISLSGVPYRYGGKHPGEGFDCSGFVAHVFKTALNLNLPSNAVAMSRVGQTVSTAELSPGDLVFFNTLANPYSHVGIYIGDERFIHSPRSGGKIEIVHMQQKYWATRFDGARRLGVSE